MLVILKILAGKHFGEIPFFTFFLKVRSDRSFMRQTDTSLMHESGKIINLAYHKKLGETASLTLLIRLNLHLPAPRKLPT